MRITKVNIPKTEGPTDGLEQIQMDRLGQVVILAGKNGSGKTRIINKIIKTLAEKPNKGTLENAGEKLPKAQSSHEEIERERKNHKEELVEATDQSRINELKSFIAENEKMIAGLGEQIEWYNKIIEWKQIETNEQSDNYKAVQYLPKDLNLVYYDYLSKMEMEKLLSEINKVGIEGLARATYATIKKTQDKWFNATHQDSQSPDEEKQKAISRYEYLKELILTFLNTTIGRDINGEPTLFGLPLAEAGLSDGQKVLLQFCIAVFAQEKKLEDLILILDEPENHLHPSVIIEVLDKILACVSNGQIWIATHSVPLIAHFDPNVIWYVEEGKISYAGKMPEKVLKGLLGDENEIAKLGEFISLPAQFGSSRYAFECLFEPSVVDTASDDPQIYQISKALSSIARNGEIRVLDYGAGRGRLISNVFDFDRNNQSHMTERLDYIAYDKNDYYKEICENAIKMVYGKCEEKYFNDIQKMLSYYDKGSFNVVIMCNVLHEIDPKDWLKLFTAKGEITSLLDDNGILLLIEDHQIPTGEKAYQKGFLVLDTPQLRVLFKIKEEDEGFSFDDARGDGRLKAHYIPKGCLQRIDEGSRREAINGVRISAGNEILKIREMEKNYKNGKLHGFWVQQYANANLTLSELTTNQ